MIGRIYKIVNDINDKIYVGQTIQTLKSRFQRHCNLNEDSNMVIKKAISKYGKEHFKIELIEELPNCTHEELDDREIYWIAYYDSFNKGYNSTKGGSFWRMPCKLSEDEETKLVSLYNQGLDSLKVAKIFNIDKTTVLNYVKKHNLQRKDTLDSRINIKELYDYIRKNKPFAEEVAEKFKISKSSVYNLIKESNDKTLVLESYHPRVSNATKYSAEICSKYKEGCNIQDLIKLYHTSK